MPPIQLRPRMATANLLPAFLQFFTISTVKHKNRSGGGEKIGIVTGVSISAALQITTKHLLHGKEVEKCAAGTKHLLEIGLITVFKVFSCLLFFELLWVNHQSIRLEGNDSFL